MTISSKSLSKVVIMLILVSFNLNVSMIDGQVDFPQRYKVYVTMQNKLPDMQQLGIQCKDRTHDLGFQVVPAGQSWTFYFNPGIINTALFFCAFNWYEGGDVHRFDIYDADRDGGVCDQCTWDIHNYGPCRVTGKGAPKCFPWKNN
ncbi:S-protein homolog 5-like [Arachis stenosperma]|uniref:S-protein homolog 5-like n=1 Tax=Arachis stenosperma TaxID=217475 RepID=UPI0025AD197E|nr:S-protein homolog 5-like [Arachis stenosperma]